MHLHIIAGSILLLKLHCFVIRCLRSIHLLILLNLWELWIFLRNILLYRIGFQIRGFRTRESNIVILRLLLVVTLLLLLQEILLRGSFNGFIEERNWIKEYFSWINIGFQNSFMLY
jgi:hypothetical protein